MCFSENQSYINTVILVITSIYIYPKYRLSIPLLFLALKDLIQGLSYRNIAMNKSTQFLTSLSWIHICFQPLFLNILVSYFDKNFKYWNIIFCICFIYGLYQITNLNEFDIQNDPDCIKENKYDDHCSKKTESYLGKYHLGYKFSTDYYSNFYFIFYAILMFLPPLFTKGRSINIIWFIFVLIIRNIFGKIGSGESVAIWCFSSIILAVPIAVFNKQISKFLV
jgi:hypothetical protein